MISISYIQNGYEESFYHESYHYIERYKPKYSVIISSKNFGFKNNILVIFLFLINFSIYNTTFDSEIYGE